MPQSQRQRETHTLSERLRKIVIETGRQGAWQRDSTRSGREREWDTERDRDKDAGGRR